MLKDITLGQFFPGDTLAHKLDPRTKLLVTVLYVVALFTAKSYIAYGVLILTLIVVAAVLLMYPALKAMISLWHGCLKIPITVLPSTKRRISSGIKSLTPTLRSWKNAALRSRVLSLS